MPRFTSVGASAANALQEFLRQRELQNRQRLMDELAVKEQEATLGLRRGDLDLRRQQDARIEQERTDAARALETERGFRRATTIADNAMPGDVADDTTASVMTEQGYGGQLVPGVLMQGPLQEGDGRPSSPTTMRGGSKYLNAEAQRESSAQIARERLESQERTGAADRALRELIAEMAAGGRAESTDLRNRLLAIQADMAQDKLETTRRDTTDKRSAVASTRAQVRDLAQGLLDDPSLEAITGLVDALTPDVRPGSVDAAARLKQLLGQLALGERGKMKGQGQISDFEGKLLANAVSAIDRRAGAANVRTHLQEIVKAFSGDTPQAGPASTAPAAGSGFKVVGVR